MSVSVSVDQPQFVYDVESTTVMVVNTPVELNDYRDVARPSQVDANQADIEPVDERAARAAAQLRVADAAIERLPFDLSTLEAGGVFVNVDTQNFGLLDRRLDWQALGIRLPRGTDLAFRPPRCGLVPDRYRLPIVAPSRAGPHRAAPHSYQLQDLSRRYSKHPPFAGCPGEPGRSLNRAFNRHRCSLSAALDDYETDFESIRARYSSTFSQLASDSARRLAATGFTSCRLTLWSRRARRSCRLAHAPATARATVPALSGWCHATGIRALGRATPAARSGATSTPRIAERRLFEQRQLAEQRSISGRALAAPGTLGGQMAAEEEERRREADIKERLRQLKLDAARERLARGAESSARRALGSYMRACSTRRSSIRDSLTETPGAARVVGTQRAEPLQVVPPHELARMINSWRFCWKSWSSLPPHPSAKANAIRSPSIGPRRHHRDDQRRRARTRRAQPHGRARALSARVGAAATELCACDLPLAIAWRLPHDNVLQSASSRPQKRSSSVSTSTFALDTGCWPFRHSKKSGSCASCAASPITSDIAPRDSIRGREREDYGCSPDLALVQTAAPSRTAKIPLSVIEYIEEAEQGLYVLCRLCAVPDRIRRPETRAGAPASRAGLGHPQPAGHGHLSGRAFPDIPELEKEVKILDLPLPEEAETAGFSTARRSVCEPTPTPASTWIRTLGAILIQALLGLTATEMENVLAKAAVRDRGFGANNGARWCSTKSET